jgi:hypothetical protein
MDTRSSRGRPALALVPPLESAQYTPTVSFCGHCGAEPKRSQMISPTRVCADCGLGLLLHCAADLAPRPGDAFLILDATLSVCGVSAAAEDLLVTTETDAIHHPITKLLVPADAEASAGANLASAISWAARGDGDVYRTVVRPANTFGVRMTARIGPCGPPQAALLVFE